MSCDSSTGHGQLYNWGMFIKYCNHFSYQICIYKTCLFGICQNDFIKNASEALVTIKTHEDYVTF